MTQVPKKWLSYFGCVIFLTSTFYLVLFYDSQSLDLSWLTRPLYLSSHSNPRPSIHLFIPVNKDGAGNDFCRVVQAAIVSGWEPIILNWDAINVDMKKEKVFGLDRVLSSERHNTRFRQDDLIFLIDAFDVWLQLPPGAMVQRFTENFETDLVISAEKNCFPNWPDSAACTDVPRSPLLKDLYWKSEEPHELEISERTPYHANSGTILGRFSKMKDFYSNLSERMREERYGGPDDQFAFNEMLAEGKVDLDYESRLFWAAHEDGDNMLFVGTHEAPDRTSDSEVIPWELYPPLGRHKLLGHHPIAIHFNGGAKPLMEEWWDKLWWASSRRFRGIVSDRMDGAMLEFVTEEGYRQRTVKEVCPDLDVWSW